MPADSPKCLHLQGVHVSVVLFETVTQALGFYLVVVGLPSWLGPPSCEDNWEDPKRNLFV